MRPSLITVLLLNQVLWASEQIPAPPQDHPILLKGGTLHTVSGGVLDNTDLLFEGGQITRIGRQLVPPPGTEILALQGKHVYPGFIAAYTTLGLVEINAVRATTDYAEVGPLNPNVRANVSYNPDSELIPVTRSNGVLLANVTPQSGRITGQSSLMMLDGWTWEEATLKHPVALHLVWPGMGADPRQTDPEEKRKQQEKRQRELKEIDDLLDQVRAYARRRSQPRRKAKNYQDRDLRLESMIPYVDRELPVFVHANEARQIRAAVHWAERQDLSLVIVGGRDAWRVSELLSEKRIPVIYESVLNLPYRRFEDYDQAYKTPALLQQAGVKFCLAASGSAFEAAHQRNLPYHAAMAAAFGLGKDQALRAITLSAAEILGVAQRVGSLEVGKDATLFICDGDPLDIRSQVEQGYIQGKKIDLNDRHKTLYNKYQQKYRQLDLIK